MNAVGIDVSKGKSLVSVVRPLGEVVAKPFAVCHTGSELKELANYLKSLDGETRVVMEHTGRYYEPVAQFLHKEKPVEEIPIKELCKVARCSRNTFYMHFEYKDNLYQSIVDECLEKIIYALRPLTFSISEQNDLILEQYMYNYLECIYSNIDTLRVILSSDINGAFQKRLTETVYNTMWTGTKQASGQYAAFTDSDEWKLICQYAANGFVGFVTFLICSTSISFDRGRELLLDVMGPTMYIGEKYLKAHS